MYQYIELTKKILTVGQTSDDRTGVGTYRTFGERMEFDLKKGFPILTTKYIHFKSVVAELLWMLSGSTNVKELQKLGVTIWDEWVDEDGELGPTYGKQWRSYTGFDPLGAWVFDTDQITNLLAGLKQDPFGRRHLVTAWNPAEVDRCRLPPCHVMFQVFVGKFGVSLQVYQRSADMFLGVPFNITSYALFTHLIALELDRPVDTLIWVGGDCHIYKNHVDQVKEQLTRTPMELPSLIVAKAPSIFQYSLEHIMLNSYEHHPAIKAPVAV